MKLTVKFQWVFNSPKDAGLAAAALSDRKECHVVSSLFVDDEQVAPVDTSDVTHVIITHLKAKFVDLWRVTAVTNFLPYDDESYDDTPEVSFSPALFDGEDLPRLDTYAEVRPNEVRGSYRLAGGEADDWRVITEESEVA